METKVYRYIGISRGGDCSPQDPQAQVGDTVREVKQSFAPMTTDLPSAEAHEMAKMDFGVYIYDTSDGHMVASFDYDTMEWE